MRYILCVLNFGFDCVFFFFFKQKTAYEMRISDWSSDVCSSDLNAGSESGGHGFLDTPIETIRELIARNVLTTTEALHIFARPMRERGRGGIVLMGSGAGLGGQPGVAVYSGVKGFVLNLAESLWAELRSEEHPSELQSLMRISYAVFCMQQKKEI